jgi:hypothetical protein
MLAQQSFGPQSKKLVPQHFPSTQVRPLPQQSLCIAHAPPIGTQQVAGSGPTARQVRPEQQLPPAKHLVPIVAAHGIVSAGASKGAGASITASGRSGAWSRTPESEAPESELSGRSAMRRSK